MQRFMKAYCYINMRLLIFAGICLISIFGCKKNNTSNDDGSAFLRIENNGTIAFDSVIVNSPGGNHVYYSVAANSVSGYKEFSFLYRYAYIKVFFDNKTATLQPFDFVGENKLDKGKYTYSLTITSTAGSNSVSLAFRRD